MNDVQRFTVTEQHLKLIKRMWVRFDKEIEWGAPAVDFKRPYGNGDLYRDMREILGMPEPDEDANQTEEREALYKLHEETATALQIAVATGYFETGDYVAPLYTHRWKKA